MLTVIGAGQAAARLIERVRAGGYSDPITLIGEEIHLPYERPPLSKGVLCGEVAAETLAINDAAFYQQAGVRLLLGERCKALDTRGKQIFLDSGVALSFRTCVFATGARARRLPGLASLPGVQSLRCLDDARRLAQLMQPGRRMVVIGGGFLGLEAASTARQAGMDVTVVHVASTLLNRVLPPSLGLEIQLAHQALGVKVLTAVEVASVRHLDAAGEGVYVIELSNGELHTADLILESVGSIANDELARNAGIECDNGVICDEHCQTSAQDVFAIGDCARVMNRFVGEAIRYESWQAAECHAKAAADAILGTPTGLDEVPWFWTDQAGFNLQLLGSLSTGRIITRQVRGTSKIMFSVGDDHVIQGAALMNAGKFRRVVSDLIRGGEPVDETALGNAEVPLATRCQAQAQSA